MTAPGCYQKTQVTATIAYSSPTGVIATFGLVLDLIGFVLFLIFVVVSSLILLTRQTRSPTPRVESS